MKNDLTYKINNKEKTALWFHTLLPFYCLLALFMVVPGPFVSRHPSNPPQFTRRPTSSKETEKKKVTHYHLPRKYSQHKYVRHGGFRNSRN